jgi:hypothetical protein
MGIPGRVRDALNARANPQGVGPFEARHPPQALVATYPDDSLQCCHWGRHLPIAGRAAKRGDAIGQYPTMLLRGFAY